MNVPNAITVFRILLIPVFTWQFLTGNYYIAAAIYVVAWFSDVLDGYIARKYNLITDFGKLFDPLADKLLNLTALFLLAYINTLPLFIPILVLAKELTLVIGGAILLKSKHQVVAAKWPGKLATVLFTVSLLFMFFAKTSAVVFYLAWILLIGALVMAFVALADYTINFLKSVKKNDVE